MSKPAVKLLYGRGSIDLTLPEAATAHVIQKPEFPPAASAEKVLATAMENPVGSEKLESLCNGCRTACILICDITRPVPNSVFLQPMIRTMMAQGIDASNITVLVATGLHRPNEGEELAELVGDEWVLETVKVVNHFAMNDEDHVRKLGDVYALNTIIDEERRLVHATFGEIIASHLSAVDFVARFTEIPVGRKFSTVVTSSLSITGRRKPSWLHWARMRS